MFLEEGRAGQHNWPANVPFLPAIWETLVLGQFNAERVIRLLLEATVNHFSFHYFCLF